MAGRSDQKQLSAYVSEDMYNWLSDDARRMGLSRAAFLRNALDWWRAERESGRLGQENAVIAPGTADRLNTLAEAETRIRELEAQIEGQEGLSREVAEARTQILILEGDVRTLNAERQGLESIVEQQRDRQGMSDALNIEMSKRLEEAHASLNRLTLALPAAGESSGSSFNWRFWQR